jgi:hypothetical protein
MGKCKWLKIISEGGGLALSAVSIHYGVKVTLK